MDPAMDEEVLETPEPLERVLGGSAILCDERDGPQGTSDFHQEVVMVA
jgi:hypothetical protein